MSVDFFTTYSLPSQNGYFWTLTTRLGEMLRLAENMYGPRDHSWTILGIEFNIDPEASPQIWYPGNCKNIAIQLCGPALNNMDIACYQLAHEAIHLLAPSGGQNANALEEGLATYFSLWYVNEHLGKNVQCTLSSYIETYEKVSELLSIDAEAIKKLRRIEPDFYKMTTDTFIQAGLNIPDTLKNELVLKFKR